MRSNEGIKENWNQHSLDCCFCSFVSDTCRVPSNISFVVCRFPSEVTQQPSVDNVRLGVLHSLPQRKRLHLRPSDLQSKTKLPPRLASAVYGIYSYVPATASFTNRVVSLYSVQCETVPGLLIEEQFTQELPRKEECFDGFHPLCMHR